VSEVSASLLVEASLVETWGYFFDSRGWPVWADGFGSVLASDGYPETGGTLRWRSGPAGRGEVTESVLEHHPRRVHRVAFTDPQAEGELTTTFEIEGEATRVTQRLGYELTGGGVFGRISDVLFIRTQQRRSLERSLFHLKHEAEEAAHFAE
jgi:hypothetical protein